MRKLLATLTAMTLGVGIAACGGGAHHATTTQQVKPAAPKTDLFAHRKAEGWGLPPKGTKLRLVPPVKGVATTEMYDTITVSAVPTGAKYLAGYTAGRWPTFAPLRALPWHPHVISIAIGSSFHAQCLDIEPGDAVPSDGPAWFRAVLSDPGMKSSLIGGKPCLYSSLWMYLNQVIPDMNAAGIARSAYWKWDADYTFVAHLDAGFDATQWTDHALGRNLDESTVTLAFVGAGHPVHKVVCVGKGALNTTQCKNVRKKLAHYQSALNSSKSAHQSTLDNISRLQSADKLFQQRIRFFSTKAAQLIKQWS